MNKFKTIFKLFFVISTLVVSITSSAQSTTTGALKGVVFESSGIKLPGAFVIIKSDSLLAGQLQTVTNSKGMYRFPALRPGLYSVEVQMSGFLNSVQNNIRVSLGNITTNNVTLKIDSKLEESIIVTAENPLISTVSSSTSTNIDEEQLDRIPLTRDANSFMNLSPGVNNNRAYGATEESANAFNLDGVNVGNPGGGDHWLLPSPDWIQEIQVGGLGADAEYGGFTGGMVNIITKSGGNDFSGSAKVYYSGGSMISENETSQSFKEFSASFGGAILKDKLWYFLSVQETREDFSPFMVNATEDITLHRYLGKLTYAFNDSNTFSFLLDYDGKFVERRGIDNETLPEATYKQESPNLSYNVTWRSIINESVLFEGKYTGFKGKDKRLPYNGSNTPGRIDYDFIAVDNAIWTRKYDVSQDTLDIATTIFAEDLFGANDSHSFKIGVLRSESSYDEEKIRNGGITIQDAYYGFDSGGEIYEYTEMSELSAYIQDSITIGNFTINPGVRYTSYKGGFDNGENDIYDVNMISPRFGLVWDIMGSGKHVLKAHYGKIYEGFYAYLFDREMSGNAFKEEVYWEWDDIDNPNYDDPFNNAFVVGGSAAEQAVLDPNIEHPYANQYLLTYEYQINENFMIGLDYITKDFRNLIAMVNINDDYDMLDAPDNPINGSDLTFYELLSAPEYVLTNPEGAYRDYESFVFRFKKRYRDGWSLRGSLVFSTLKGNTYANNGFADEWKDLNGQTNVDGKLPGYSDFEAKIDFSYDLPWDSYVSIYYTFLSGEHWTPYAEIRGLYYNDRTDVYLEKRGSEQYPDNSLIDIKFTKTFKFSNKSKLDISLDIFNLLNENTVLDMNEQWGRYYYQWDAHPEESEWVERSSYQNILLRERVREIRLGFKFTF